MQNSSPRGRRGTDVTGAAVTSSSANAPGKEKIEALWQRGVNFVSSNISPLIVIGASSALAGMCAMSLWNKVNETIRPSAERLANGDKGMSARQPFGTFCAFCAL
tara:strand:- start:176 stop:490 length:315 start_codon:yes stop_codon:yes gene_type:complete